MQDRLVGPGDERVGSARWLRPEPTASPAGRPPARVPQLPAGLGRVERVGRARRGPDARWEGERGAARFVEGTVVGPAPAASASCSRPSFRACESFARSQACSAMTLTPFTPVRRRRPYTARRNPWKIAFAHQGCTRSNTVASARPVPSSRVRKMMRWPLLTAGVCDATFTPATMIHARPAGRPGTRGRDHAEVGEQRLIERQQVLRGVEAEHLELGLDPSRRRVLPKDAPGRGSWSRGSGACSPSRATSAVMAMNSRSRRDPPGRASNAPACASASTTGRRHVRPPQEVAHVGERPVGPGLEDGPRLGIRDAVGRPSTPSRMPYRAGPATHHVGSANHLDGVRPPRCALTSRGRISMSWCRASSRISRRGYMPGSWVRTPARKWAG